MTAAREDDSRDDTVNEDSLNYDQAHLVKMVNQIAANVPNRDEAPAQIAAHLRSFWTPQMRIDITAISDDYPDLLDPQVRTALEILRRA